MTREEAKHIDAFKYWCDTNEENGVITIPKFICENIVKILDDNKQRLHGEWIPCSDRVPKESGYYLVTTDGSHNHVIDIAEYGFDWRGDDFVIEWNKASKILAWMPLPKPYEKEGDKNETNTETSKDS